MSKNLTMDYEAVPKVVAQIIEDAETISKAADSYREDVEKAAKDSNGAAFLVELANNVTRVATISKKVVTEYKDIDDRLRVYIRQFKELEAK